MTAPRSTATPLLHLAVSAATLASFAACKLIFNLIGLRTLGADAVGRVNAALSWSLLISLVVTAGLVPGLSRFLPLAADQGRQRLTARVIVVAFAITLPLAAGLLAASALRLPTTLPPALALVAAVWALLFSAYTIVRTHWFAQNEPTAAGMLEVLSVLGFAGGMIAASRRPSLAWLPFTLYFVPSAARAVQLLRHRTRSSPFPPSFLQFSGVALLGSVATVGTAYAATLVVVAVSGYDAAARWATLVSLTSPLLLFPRTLGVFFLPKLTALHAAGSPTFESLSRVHQSIASAGAAVLAGVALPLSSWLLQLSLGPHLVSSDLIVWHFLWIGLFALVRVEPLITALSAMGDQSLPTSAAWIGALLCGLLWLFYGSRLGAPAVAAGYAVVGVTCLILVSTVLRLRLAVVRLRLCYADLMFLTVAALSWFAINRGSGPLIAGALVLIMVATIEGLRALSELRVHLDVSRGQAAMVPHPTC